MKKSTCYFPFKVDNKNFGTPGQHATIPVPCGKCPYCLQRRANGWVFRCMQEIKIADSAIWCTLTYKTPPLSCKNLMTLRKKDFQNFMKRLRKMPRSHSTQSIKYYACGEYGDTYERPHYHAVIFNSSPEHIRKAWEGFSSLSDEGGVHLGITHFDEVNSQTVLYTAKYMNKGKLIPKFDGDDRAKEFQLFSKGLGLNYLTPEIRRWHLDDPKRLYTFVDGFKKALPRYFRLKLYSESDRSLQAEYAQTEANKEYVRQYDEYLVSKSHSQTFEEFRYARKKAAIDHFRSETAKRSKFK